MLLDLSLSSLPKSVSQTVLFCSQCFNAAIFFVVICSSEARSRTVIFGYLLGYLLTYISVVCRHTLSDVLIISFILGSVM